MQNFWSFVLSTLIVVIVLWMYRKLTKAYQTFPSVSIWRSFIELTGYLLIPRGIPVTSFAFQKLVALSKGFENEGMFIIWIFRPVLIIISEEATKVFSNEKAAMDKSTYYELMKPSMGKGTLTRNGEDWKKHRKMFNSVFYTDMLKRNTSATNEYASIMISELATVTNKPIDLLAYLKEFSFCVVSEFLLGIKMREGENKQLGQKVLKTVQTLNEYITHRVCYPWMQYQIFMNTTAYGRSGLKWFKERNRVVSEIISQMKTSISLSSSETKSDNGCGQSFAAILLERNMKDPSFTLKDMEDEIYTFLSAGYDTVSYALLWCLFLLGHHQDVQNKVFMELQTITKEFITYDDIYRLKYLECVIKETLRIYPTVPIFGRLLKEDVLCGKYKVPKGTNLTFFPYMLHRNSEIFPDPESFNPDRFLDGSVEKHPWAYVPFAEGIRSCMGKKFALMELTIFLAYIIRNFKMQSLVERECVVLDWTVTLTPLKPLFMKLTLRKP